MTGKSALRVSNSACNLALPGTVAACARHFADEIPVRMPHSSTGFVSNHLDAVFEPQYPFGYGLSYDRFV